MKSLLVFTRAALSKVCFCSLVLWFITQPSFAQSSATVGVGVDSNYITEGRDNFNGQQLQQFQLWLSYDTYTAGVWAGQAADRVMAETLVALGKQLTSDASLVNVQLFYSYIRFDQPDGDDHELESVFSTGDSSGFASSVSLVYSYQSDGFYLNYEATYGLALSKWTIAPYVSFGVNHGYIAGEHDGVDHYVYGLRTDYALANLTFGAHVNYTTPINLQADDSLVETLWGGLGLALIF